MASNGWGVLGQALGGLLGGDGGDSYVRGQAKGAQLNKLLADASISRSQAMMREDEQAQRLRQEENLVAAGWNRDQARLAAGATRAGIDPRMYGGYQGQMQEQGFRQGSVNAALAGDLQTAGAYSIGLANGPLELTKISDSTAYNPYALPGQNMQPTAIGNSEIQKNNMQGRADLMRAMRTGGEGGGGGASRGKAPSGYMWTPDGELSPIPGGPADKGSGGGRPLPAPTINKLAGDADTLNTLDVLSGSFKKDFAGNKVGGQAENFAGRLGLPGATPGQSDWWQQYDRMKNKVRNELFGAALTPSEQAEFDKADINPNMSPATIAKNLGNQKEIIRKGLQRQARTWAAQGYSKDALREATGIPDPFGGGGLPPGTVGNALGGASPPGSVKRYNPATGRLE